ncbi:MAG: branched-chain amino acid ABC transporter substrate-binding protein [Anaerolineae bacterium]|nr:branched-chain amino acid ABC transporter substrate-binding protein [Anaerolineae bacterium]
MKKGTYGLLAALLLVALFATACGGAAEPKECADDPLGCAVVAKGDTIKIGYAGPTQGEYSAFGTDISQGGLIAIDDFGEFNGFQFELVIEDTGGAPEGGAAVANKFISEPSMVAIAGHTFSGSTEAAIPIYDDAGFPMLSPSATNPSLTEMGSLVFNRIAFTDTVQGINAAEYIYNKLGATKIAVMHDGGAYGQGLAEIVKSEFEKLGGEVVAFEAITPGETDYSAPLAGIAALEPEVLYFGGYDADAAVLKNQMASSGLEGVTFFSDDGCFGQNFLDLTGENSEGTIATSLIPPTSPEKEAFDAAYEERWGDPPGTLSPFTWNGYDIVAALISVAKDVAIEQGGNLYFPRSAMVEGVRGLEGYNGLSGVISCDATGECNTTGPTFYIAEGGKWVQAP